MGFELISNEKNIAKVKLTISAEDFDAAVNKVYQKSKGRFNIPGFRKGKVPRAIIESRYGKEIFYEDALEEAFPAEYTKCLEDGNFKASAAPKLIEIDKIDENGAVVTIDISLKPEFEVAQYKGIKIEPIKYTAKKADLDAEIASLREQNSRLVSLDNEKSKKDDTLNINFEGFIDDKAFEGGKGENYPLILGSNTFIPGFEEQLLGKKAGDKVDVNVKFPKEYHVKELADKNAVFKVEVLSMQRKELPEVNDDFAVDLGYENVDDMNKALKEKIKEQKLNELKQKAQTTLMNELVEKTQIDIPPMMLTERAEDIKRENDNMLKQNGLDPEQYYKYLVQTSEDKDPEFFKKIFNEQADREIRTELITEKIIEAENFEVDEKKFDEECEKYAKAYGKKADEFKESLNDYMKDYIQYAIKQEMMYDFLIDNAKTDSAKKDTAKSEK